MPVVLLVEDDRDVREAVAAVLESDGYCVAPAEHGREALALLREGVRPCAIVLDLMMPEMDGFEFRARQTQDPALAKIPVIVLSGAGERARHLPRLGGIYAYLQKPADAERMITLVRECCRTTGTGH